MKKVFTTLFAVLAMTFAFAQVAVPNGGLEEWTDTHTPVGWNATFNASVPVDYLGFTLDVIINYQAATRNATAHSGSYAAQISTQTANATMGGIVCDSFLTRPYVPMLPDSSKIDIPCHVSTVCHL